MRRDLRGKPRHRGVEIGGLIRVLCEVCERIKAEDLAKGRLAGLNAVQQIAPGALGHAAEQARSGSH